jgi:predicted dehydrogenase/threonine dehydrogenase-like Zn-dependent dehydrogenase
MKQLIQDLSSGETRLLDVARPAGSAKSVVIDSRVSLVSAGTERMLVGFGKASLINKARQQPEKVRQVINKIGTDGLLTTIDAVRSKLGQPIPLGYCNVGIAAEVGDAVRGIKQGDRLVSNGSHAETVRVPANLCARIPDSVSDEMAAFTVLASIGLQGIRLASPTLGENVVVMGAGLIGLLTAQMLLANGCRVLVTDFDESKLALARKWGAATCNLSAGADPVVDAASFAGSVGVDAVIITASTPSNDPVKQAANMCRKRGRIVLVGVVGLQLDRADFYEKELTFQVSCSYGPGRYDPNYEEAGIDYPPGYVRWTEQRNFEAVLELMAAGRIDVSEMVSLSIPFEEAPAAYERLVSDKALLGVLLNYDAPLAERQARTVSVAGSPVAKAGGSIAVVGAGNYATRVLIPAFRDAGARFSTLVTTAGLSGGIAAEKFGFASSTTDFDAMLSDTDNAAVLIATQHDSHAGLASRALRAGKAVFVEKPLAVDRDGLAQVRAAYAETSSTNGPPLLMVGFNRRWAPLVVRMKGLLDSVSASKSIVITVNAGAIPAGHWTQDSEKGGGRIVGEACHFIDLMRFLAGHPITAIHAQAMPAASGEAITDDKVFILIDFADGSHGVINYLANGAASFPKERIEVFTAQRMLQLDNYRALRGFDWPGFRQEKRMRVDKGQAGCAEAFMKALRGEGPLPIAPDELFEVAEHTIDAAEQVRRS